MTDYTASGTIATNDATLAGNPTLHFLSLPAWVVVGMSVQDVTAPSVIPTGTVVLATTMTTVTLSTNVTGSGVGNGDSIYFTAWLGASAHVTDTAVSVAIVTDKAIATAVVS